MARFSEVKEEKNNILLFPTRKKSLAISVLVWTNILLILGLYALILIKM